MSSLLGGRLAARGKAVVKRVVPPAVVKVPRLLLWHRTFATIHLKDAMDLRQTVRSPQEHLAAAMQWLARAQDATEAGGVAASWSEGLYQAAYPETTGYILETLFDYAQHSGDASFRLRAERAAAWELQVQLPSGAFPSGTLDDDPAPTVFNTGQVLFGLCRAHGETSDAAFLKAARAAGDWLVAVQDDSGAWLKHLSPMANSPVRTFNTRVAWALAELHRITGDHRFGEAAGRNIDWALTQQLHNGWLESVAPIRGTAPLTHFIAYTIRGILECGRLLERPQYVDAARRALGGLLAQERAGRLPALFDRRWRPVEPSSCLTGNAQTAICCQRLSDIAGEDTYLPAARRLMAYLMSTQDLTHPEPGIRGGIKGSQPVYGYYAPYVMLSWATKFFAEALLWQLRPERAPGTGAP